MITLEAAISAIADFLNEAQKLGLIKEYSLIQTENNKNELPDASHILSNFVKTISRESASILALTTEAIDNTNSEVLQVTKEERKLLEDEADSKSKTVNAEESPERNLVQIQVDGNEIKRRISAFISRKRKEVDEWNVQEFCSRPYIEEQNPAWDQIDSCARVDTVFVPRLGSKSHVKVSKVENRWGPQTHMQVDPKKIKLEHSGSDSDSQANETFQAIEERLSNMESHLKLKSDTSLRLSVFQRLKNLEDRILYLEGISPDYFDLHGTNYSSPKKKTYSDKRKLHSNMSLDDIQKRIQVLKETLKRKPQPIKSEPPE